LLDARIGAAEERFRTSRSLAESACREGLRRQPEQCARLTGLAGYSFMLGTLTAVYAALPL
jgi:hypothetical protein